MPARLEKEHVLIALFGHQLKQAVAAIGQHYPEFEVTCFPIKAIENFVNVWEVGDEVPKEVWQKTTVLVTLFALPRSEDLAPNLKYIHLFSAGIDHFKDHPILTSSSIPMSISTGIAAPPIAEYIIMTLLSLTNRLPKQIAWQQQKHWGPKVPFLMSSGDWIGKTVGIAGYGSIGRHTARILVAMGAKVHALTAEPRDTPESRRDSSYHIAGTGDPDGTWPTKWFSGTDKASLHKFLGSGLHAVVICLPLTPATKKCFGAEELTVLQQTTPFTPSSFDPEGGPVAGGFLINISRGAIMDQDALTDALKRKVIRAAALDVTDPEPLPQDSELWGLENCMITPHTSALGSEYSVRGFEVFMDNLRLWRESGEIGNMWNLVRRGRGY